MTSYILIKSLDAGYGNNHILYDVSFAAKKREITCIIGPNGSGKSTLLKSIFGLCNVYKGRIKFEENSLVGLASHEISRRKIAYLPQTNNVFTNLTVKENLIMAGYTLDSKKFDDRYGKVFEMFSILKEYENQKSSILSGGQRQMLAMGMALIREPQIILFDEPTASLSPKIAQQILESIKQLKDLGITIILVEQNVKRALEISDYVYLLANGKNVFDGLPKELTEKKDLGKMYLGI